MKTFNLSPIDGRKTMAKQHVNIYDVNGQTISDLISYTSKVASYNHATNEIEVFNVPNVLSKTTLRHIKAFFDFYGFDVPTKQELKTLYNL